MIASPSAGSGNPASNRPWLDGLRLIRGVLFWGLYPLGFIDQFANVDRFSLLVMRSPGQQMVAEFMQLI